MLGLPLPCLCLMVAVALVWAWVPPNATNALWSVNPSFYHHFIMIISSLITRLVSSLDPRIKRQLSRNVQNVWFNSAKKYLRDIEIRILLFIQSVQSVFLSFEMVFNLLKAKLELLWCIERTVCGLQAAWRVLFIIFRHMTTQYHSSNEMRLET